MFRITSEEYTRSVSEIDKLLQQNVGKRLLVRLKNNITVQGNLKNFDQHLNLTLNDGEMESKETVEQFNKMLLRGSEILIVSFSS